MKTIEEVKKENPDYAILIDGVMEQLGICDPMSEEDVSDIQDINQNGISGYAGFIYHSDTCKFAKKYHKEIIGMAIEQAYQYNETLIEFINSFYELDNTGKEIAMCQYIANGESENDNIPDCLAKFFAGEGICRLFEN